MLRLDGAQRSGSGTIIRTAVTLATLKGEELHIWNIRAKRGKPGLRPQHLQAIRACQEICQGEVEGARVGSREIFYRPGQEIRGGHYEWNIGTAGSTTMLALTILPLACFASGPLNFRVTGGLFQDFAPSAFHTKYVLLPLLRRMGLEAELEIERPGYVPEGGGVLSVRAKPARLRALKLTDRGQVSHIRGIALSSHLKEAEVSERMAEECRRVLQRQGLEAAIETLYDDQAAQKGAALGIWAETTTGCLIGADMAGRPGRRSEQIARRVAQDLLQTLKSGATVDRFLADQLIIYCALAEGTSEYTLPELTDHVETNLWLAEEILGAEIESEGNRVRVHGIGFRRKILC